MERNYEMQGRGKCLRLAAIFLLSGVLAAVSLIRVMTWSPKSSSNNHVFESVMMVLVVVLVCCVVEVCWRPFNVGGASPETPSDPESSSTSDGFVTNDEDAFQVRVEPPPSYEEVLRTPQSQLPPSHVNTHNDNQQHVPSPKSVLYLSRMSQNPKPADSEELQEEVWRDRPNSIQGRSDDHDISSSVPHSPYFSQELQLSVDGLPSYEEAVAAFQRENGMIPDSEYQDGNDLILFI